MKDKKKIINFLDLGIKSLEDNQILLAIDYFEKAHNERPESITINNNLGLAYKKTFRYKDAINCFKKIIEIKPNIPEAHNNLGNIFKDTGLIKESERSYLRALVLKPNSLEYYNNLAVFYLMIGNNKKAEFYYKKILSVQPNNLYVYFQLSKFTNNILDKYLKNRIIFLEKQKLPNQSFAFLHFLKSKYNYRDKNYKDEFKNLITGHKYFLKSANKNYFKDLNYWLNQVPTLINKFDSIEIANPESNIRPIFIFGVPRSGTTLVESIISASDESIKVGEETMISHYFIKEFVEQKKDKDAFTHYVSKIINSYQEKSLITKNNNRFTDKSLENFFYFHLIRKIFPKAKFINCKRNEKNSMMSILKNNLISIPWAHDLNDIFLYFDNYLNIVKKYKRDHSKLIYEIELEKLTESPESETKALLNFCNLKWSTKCLKFYNRSDLTSKTLSQNQIRNPIYKQNSNEVSNYYEFLKLSGKKYSWFS